MTYVTDRAASSAEHTNFAAIIGAIMNRRSIRSFLPQPIDPKILHDILATASRAPSGSNIQPWRVYVFQGKSKSKLDEALFSAFDAGDMGDEEYQYYPSPWREPYLARRRKVGRDLYGLLGIERADKAGMARQLRRNYNFFDAPVGMIFTIDRDMPVGSWLDYGMFLQNIMIAARAFGLETCPQQAFASYHKIIRAVTGCGNGQVVICGIALGYADWSATVNQLETERVSVEEFTTFL